MAKLPFVVEPRLKPVTELVGTEDSGKIEIERRGFLSAGEKAFFSNGSQDSNVSELMIGLVRKVSSKYKLDMKEAYELTSGVISGDSDSSELTGEIREVFQSDVNAVISAVIHSSARNNFLKAFSLLLYRVNPEITADDVMEVHPDIMDDLVALFDDEEMKSTKRLIAAHGSDKNEEVIEDIEKKSARAK